jgi:hypothetical protein
LTTIDDNSNNNNKDLNFNINYDYDFNLDLNQLRAAATHHYEQFKKLKSINTKKTNNIKNNNTTKKLYHFRKYQSIIALNSALINRKQHFLNCK